VSTTARRAQLESMTQLLHADPGNAALHSHCVNLAISLADYDHARALIDARLRHAPDDARTLFDSATLLIAQKNYAAALSRLESLVAQRVEAPGVRLNIGLCQYCLGQYESVTASLQQLYQAGERSPGLLRLYVSALHHAGSVDAAVEVADQHSEAAQQDGALSGVYALLYLDAEKVGAAARWAKTALKLNPDSVDGLVVDGTLLTMQTRLSQARSQFEHALQLAPDTGRAWLGLATLALLERDLPQANQLIERSLRTMSAHVGTWHLLGWTQLAAQDLAGAEKTFQHALQMDRNFAETHGALAAIAALQGKRAVAENSIEIAERLDPQCLSTQLARAILLTSGGNAGQAQELIEKTLTMLGGTDSSALAGMLIPKRRTRG
jgi:tetratricopeptide (TPR) repeat protein